MTNKSLLFNLLKVMRDQKVVFCTTFLLPQNILKTTVVIINNKHKKVHVGIVQIHFKQNNLNITHKIQCY